MAWSNFFQSLTQLIFAAPCPLCQRSSSRAPCPRCWQQLLAEQAAQSSSIEILPWLQPPLGAEGSPGRSDKSAQPWLFTWGIYDGQLKRAIAALKYDGHPTLAQPLGRQLGQAWCSQLENLQGHLGARSALVVPIPLHRDRQRQRGFNQAELLAVSFCQTTGLPLKRQGLRRTKATTAQFQLGARERAGNLADAFSLGPDFATARSPRVLRQPPVILLDDIYTSGATVKAAIATLAQAQIPVAGVVSLARTIRPAPSKSSRPVQHSRSLPVRR